MAKNLTEPYREYREGMTGPYHDFWLLRERENEYKNYSSFLARRDAPVRIPDTLLRYFYDTLGWVPTLNPAMSSQPQHGLNLYGPTIVNYVGGQRFADVSGMWARLLSLGPEALVLSIGSMGIVGESGELEDQGWGKLEAERDDVVQKLNVLEDWGGLAATGESFILHLGI